MGLLLARRGSLHPRRAAGSDAYADEVTADSPFAWLRLSETSGGTVLDETVNGNNATVTGADLNVSGAVGTGSAVSFDGVDDDLDWGTIPDSLSPFTFEFWMKTTTTSPGYFFGAIARNSFFGRLNSEGGATAVGKTDFFIRPSASGSSFTRWSINETQLYNGSWHHVAITLTVPGGASRDIVTYVDGASVTLTYQSTASNSAWGTMDLPFLLGAATGLAGRGLLSMDEPAMYSSALSAARVSARYNAGVS